MVVSLLKYFPGPKVHHLGLKQGPKQVNGDFLEFCYDFDFSNFTAGGGTNRALIAETLFLPHLFFLLFEVLVNMGNMVR